MSLKSVLFLIGAIILLSAAELKADEANSLALTAVLGNKEYFVGVAEKANWYYANEVCALRNMVLTSIESEAEYKKLSDFLYNNSKLDLKYWISGSDLAQADQFTWLATGKDVDYTKWASGQPTGSGCLLTDVSFKWTVGTCADEHYFICSRPAVPYCSSKGSCIYPNNLF